MTPRKGKLAPGCGAKAKPLVPAMKRCGIWPAGAESRDLPDSLRLHPAGLLRTRTKSSADSRRGWRVQL